MARDVPLRLSTRRPLVAPATAGLFAAVLAAAATAAHAAPLPPETCDALRAEVTLLEGGGAGSNFERGVEWGKANLTPEQMRYVARLIALREQVAFRCRPALIEMPTPPLPPPAPEPVEADKVPLPERRQQAEGGVVAPAAKPTAGAASAKSDAAKVTSPARQLDAAGKPVSAPSATRSGAAANRPATPAPKPKPLVEAPAADAARTGTARQ